MKITRLGIVLVLMTVASANAFARGSQSATGTGAMSGTDGSGTWKSAGGDCSGTWTAERRS